MSQPARDSLSTYPLHHPPPSSQGNTAPRSVHESSTFSLHITSPTSFPQASTAVSAGADNDGRPFLPSISNLLGIAGARRPADSPESQYRDSRLPQQHHERPMSISPTSQARSNPRWNRLETANHAYNKQPPAMGMEPPQRPPEQAYDAAYSPTRPYVGSPSAASDASYYSPTSATGAHPSAYAAQHMVSGHAQAASSQSGLNAPAANPWEHHHHYIAQQAQQRLYPPLPDRYVCPTCSKAFSRPSSLKIHSHSHTGEKPFKCPHAGCGKAFSVKSNMKRHEKGCHGGGDQAQPGASMSDI